MTLLEDADGGMMQELENALPRCPPCLVLIDVEGTVDLPYAECPVCHEVMP